MISHEGGKKTGLWLHYNKWNISVLICDITTSQYIVRTESIKLGLERVASPYTSYVMIWSVVKRLIYLLLKLIQICYSKLTIRKKGNILDWYIHIWQPSLKNTIYCCVISYINLYIIELLWYSHRTMYACKWSNRWTLCIIQFSVGISSSLYGIHLNKICFSFLVPHI